MSIETVHNSLEINEMFNRIKTENQTKELKKSEKCRLIRNYYYDSEYSTCFPDTYKSIIYTDTPMLCLRMKQLEQKEQIDLWKSDDYIADEKIDGIRCYLVYNYEYEKNNGYELFSRENDETTLLPKIITNNINKIIKKPETFYKSFLLDCEMTIDENMNIKIYVFDCIFYNNNYITDETWKYRRFITEKIVESINTNFIKVTEYRQFKKIDFYNHIKEIGGEGVVIKNVNSKYSTKGTRSKYNWIKVKGNVFDYSIIEDTLEGYISEKPNLENQTLALSAFINNEELSNKIAIIPLSMFNTIKNNISNYSVGLGSVVEFASSFYSGKDNLFVNSFPVKIRADKTIRDCYYSKKDIDRWTV